MDDLLILGAGASGLSLGVLLPSSKIIEAKDKVGGLSQTIQLDGFTFDQGPHIMFSKNKDILQIMIDSLKGNVHSSKRNNVVMIDGCVVQYPIENDLGSLPNEVKFAAVRDFFNAKINPTKEIPTNLEDWFISNFGNTLTNIYFKPYNEKVWNLPFHELSMIWSERIPSPPWEDVLKGALGSKTEGYLHQLYYQYPLIGGYESLVTAWADKVSKNRIRTASPVRSIKRIQEKTFQLNINGSDEIFEGNIISTLPLYKLAKIFQGLPTNISNLIKTLPVNPLITVNLGFKRKDENMYTAVYIPDKDFLVNRISFPGVFSPMNVPSDEYQLIQAEITCKSNDGVMSWTDSALVNHVLDGLKKRQIIPKDEEPIFLYVDRIQDAYVVYPNNFESTRSAIIESFESQDIYLNGRFGSHNYLNVDGILMQSIEMAKRFDSTIDIKKVRGLFGLEQN